MSSGYQRAAITLSALSRRDRQWILANLANEERRQLVDALSEFNRSGPRMRPADLTAVVDEIDAADAKSEVRSEAPRSAEAALNGPAAAGSEDPLQRLRLAAPTDLLYVLSAEPDWLIAVVCSAANWPWSDEFFAMIGAERAKCIQRYIKQRPRSKPMLRDTLVAVLAQRLANTQDNIGFTVAMDEAHEAMTKSRVQNGWKARLSSWLL